MGVVGERESTEMKATTDHANNGYKVPRGIIVNVRQNTKWVLPELCESEP